MAILEIIKYFNPILKIRADEVNGIDDRIKKLISDMVETMYSLPGTIGLSAPQIGESKRVIVVDVSKHKKTTKTHELLRIINPSIIHMEGEIIVREGCISLPEYTANVKRAEKVIVNGLNAEEKPLEINTEGLEAIALQHEIDHLDGILFIDRVVSLKTDIFRRKTFKY